MSTSGYLRSSKGYAAAHRDALQDRIRDRDKYLSDKIAALVRVWNQCQTPQTEQTLFLAAGADMPHAAKVSRVQAALDSCLSSLIAVQRAKILEMWETLKVGPQQRSLVPTIHKTEISEHVLHEHDCAINELLQRMTDAYPLLKKIETFQLLLQERDSLMAATRDATRLLDRNTNSYRWRKAEDRLQTLTGKILPQRKRTLLLEICEWEHTSGNHYLIWDERYLDFLVCGYDHVDVDPTSLDPIVAAQMQLASHVDVSSSESSTPIRHEHARVSARAHLNTSTHHATAAGNDLVLRM
jgi:hypothetical protein